MAHMLQFEETPLRKGTWSCDEDLKLVGYIKNYGIWNWNQMARAAGLARTGKSCRLRWMNYLKPNLKHGNFTEEEDEIILNLHKKHGNSWAAIAEKLPGRTDNDIKNHWNTRLCKIADKRNYVKHLGTELPKGQLASSPVLKGRLQSDASTKNDIAPLPTSPSDASSGRTPNSMDLSPDSSSSNSTGLGEQSCQALEEKETNAYHACKSYSSLGEFPLTSHFGDQQFSLESLSPCEINEITGPMLTFENYWLQQGFYQSSSPVDADDADSCFWVDLFNRD